MLVNNYRRAFFPAAVICLFCLVCAASAREVNYFEGFEGKKNPVQFWTCGPHGNYQVNYAGPSTERVRSGKQSYKFDITFIGDGNFSYWAGPTLDIPAVPGMKMSGYIYLEQVPPNVNAGMGHSFFLPAYKFLHPTASGRGSCGPISQLGARSVGKWIPQEADLNMVGESMSKTVMKEATPGVCLEKWYIHINCRQATNARLILYLDDVSITGTVPDNWEQVIKQELADWENDAKSRDQASLQEFEAALAPVRRELMDALKAFPGEESLRRIAAQPWGDYARNLSLEMQAKAAELQKQTAAGQKGIPRTPIRVGDQTAEYLRNLRDTGIRPLRYSVANLKKLSGCTDPFLTFIRDNPVSNYRITRATNMIDGAIGNRISLSACPGEYEPAAFVVLPSKDTVVTFDITDLRGQVKVIKQEALNLRAVKVWYQAGIDVGEVNKRIATPELLLKDDDLVQVDHQEKVNTVRNLDAPQDSPELLPVRVSAGEPKQFWLTVHVPEDAAPGEYTGKIVIHAEGLGDRELELNLRVLPIELQEPHLEYSIYYRAYLGAPPNFVSSDLKTPQQLEAEFRNLKAHGITNPNVYQPFGGANMDQYLEIRKRAGLKMTPIYYLGVGTGSFAEEKEIADHLALIKQVIAYFRGKGADEVYFYGADEATGEELKRQRRMWQAIHDVGGKIFVACAMGFFDVIGDLLDCPIIVRQSPAEVERVHAAGHKAHNYGNPSGAIEQPYTFRYHAGLWLVRNNMDGFHTYAYQHGQGEGKMMGRMWDDFDNKIYRVVAFAYPTVNGVVDTLQWEGVREGVDDVRYLTTLRKAIAAGKKSANPLTMKLAQESEIWLRTVSIEGDLQEVRRQMIQRILALTKELK